MYKGIAMYFFTLGMTIILFQQRGRSRAVQTGVDGRNMAPWYVGVGELDPFRAGTRVTSR